MIKNRIKELRMQRGMTQQDLGNLLGVDRATVAQWETGGSNPRVSMLPGIMQALKVKHLDQIFLVQ